MMPPVPVQFTDRVEGGRPRTLWWGALVAALFMLAIAIALWRVGVDHGPTPAFLATPMRAREPAERSVAGSGLVIAGSGSNLPVTRALATAYAAAGGEAPVVHTSIGSGGGIRALRDGAIDIALISRPLKADERAAGLVAVPYARAPVMFAVHASVTDRGLRSERVVPIYAGEQAQWNDGTSVVVLQREPGDSSHAAVARALPGFDAANEQAYQQQRWRVLHNDAAMDDALASTEGAIGLVGSGALPDDLPIRALALDGVEPSVATVADGSYPLSKDLSFVTRGEPEGQAAELIRFALSPAGSAVIEESGCVPLGGEGPRGVGGS
jgi:phosphate transport system substrate-binding protein